MKKRKIVIVFALAAAVSALYAANAKVSLTSHSFKEITVTDKEGRRTTKLVDTKKVLPGDTVVYRNMIDNGTQKPVRHMVLNNPIPKEVAYIAESAGCQSPCTILFSVDHGKHFAAPEHLKIKNEHGSRIAKPDEYTDIRWILKEPLPAHKKTYVTYKARLR